jgi:hypothetical protein
VIGFVLYKYILKILFILISCFRGLKQYRLS